MANSETNWIFDGCPRYSEFREEIGTDDDQGLVVWQAVQRRTVYQFRRHKLYCNDGTLQIDDGQLGEETIGAEITAKQGSLTINASIIYGASKWLCMADDLEPMDGGLHAYKRVQVWEKRDTWEDYAWPVAT